VVDREILQIPACALEIRNGHPYLIAKYLPVYIAANSERLAWFHLKEDGWAYFDRTGRILVTNVAMMDNGPNAFHHGLVRVVKKNKYGLANLRGELVVPYRYDGMLDYESRHGWRACMGCRYEQVGEYGDFVGGDWYWLNRYGRRGAKAPPEESLGASQNHDTR
jgi:hypothetical protein